MEIFRIRHETVYRYRSPVAFGEHRLMLRPRVSYDQQVIDYRLEIDPKPARIDWSEDASGNLVAVTSFSRRASELNVVAHSLVARTIMKVGELPIAVHARSAPFSYGAEEVRDLARFIERQYVDPDHAVDKWAQTILGEDPTRETWAFLTRINAVIRRDFAYLRREEPGIQSPSETLKTGRGSCRDFAVLMCEAVRTFGMAARFVSGYLHVPMGDERLRRAGGSTHAWLQVYLPGGGWVDFDPTSGGIGNCDLIRVAVVRDPPRASPLSGTFTGFPSDYEGMMVNVDVLKERTPKAASASSAAA